MSTQTLLGARLLASLCVVAEIGIHLFLLPDHLEEQPYIGGLFIASAVILTAVVVGLGAPGLVRAASYLVGAIVCVAMFGGFVASRTVGLPMGYLEGWFTDHALGIVSLAFEVIFVACAALVLARAGCIRTIGYQRLRPRDTLFDPARGSAGRR